MKDNKKKTIKKALIYAYLEGSLLTDRGFSFSEANHSIGSLSAFDEFKKSVKLSEKEDLILTACACAYFDEIINALVDFDLLKIDL